jgi:hypothetical protein
VLVHGAASNTGEDFASIAIAALQPSPHAKLGKEIVDLWKLFGSIDG